MYHKIKKIFFLDTNTSQTAWIKLVFLPQCFSLLTAIGLTLIVFLSFQINFSAFIITSGAIWFGIHHVPLSITEMPLHQLPILTVIIIIVLMGKCCYKALKLTNTNRDRLLILISSVVSPLVTSIVLLIIMNLAADNFLVLVFNQIFSLLIIAVIYLIAYALAYFFWLKDANSAIIEKYLFEIVLLQTSIKTIIFWFWIALGLGFCFVLVFIVDIIKATQLYHGFLNIIGVWVISLIFVPNIIIWIMEISAGASLHLGEYLVGSGNSITGKKLPAIPILNIFSHFNGMFLFCFILVLILVSLYQSYLISINFNINNSARTKIITQIALLTGGLLTVLSIVCAGDLGQIGLVGGEILPSFIGSSALLIIFNHIFLFFQSRYELLTKISRIKFINKINLILKKGKV